MTVNLYLANEILEQLGAERYNNGVCEIVNYKGFKIIVERDELHVIWSDAPVPADLKPFLKEISCHCSLQQMAPRESGVYKLRGASCELMPGTRGKGENEVAVYNLRIRGQKMEDVNELVHLIKTGKIRPEESYEAPQCGRSNKELESQNADLRAMLEIALRDFETAQRDRGELRVERDRYKEAYELCKKQCEEASLMLSAANAKLDQLRSFVRAASWWPLMISWRVKSKIGKIVFD